MSVQDILNYTRCPFAKGAKLSIINIPSLNLVSEIAVRKNTISDFFKVHAKDDLDALVFIFEDYKFGSTLENLTHYTKQFFKALEREFIDLEVPESIDDYSKIEWPKIEGERFFMVSFANCYPPSSPRYNYGDRCTYFFLQPVSSFERHAQNGDYITDEYRLKIRSLFEKYNQPYDGNISNLRNEWVKMVAPMHLGDDVVKWWEN